MLQNKLDSLIRNLEERANRIEANPKSSYEEGLLDALAGIKDVVNTNAPEGIKTKRSPH